MIESLPYFINIFNIWESDMKVCDTRSHIISVNTLKKLVASLSICACLSMLTYADESNDSTDNNGENQNKIVLGIFGGGSLMQMSLDYYGNNAYEDLPGDHDKSLFGASYGAKVGYDMYFLTRHGVRIYVDYMNSYFNSNERTLGSYNMHTIGLNADYRFVITGGLSAFAGAGLAHNIINTQHLGNMNAFGGSINAGVAYALSFLEFEFRIRYLIYDIQEKYSTQGLPPMVAGQQVKYQMVELNSPFSFHLGVNFRF